MPTFHDQMVRAEVAGPRPDRPPRPNGAGDGPPTRRRVLIATPVSARLAAMAAGPATVRPELAARPDLLADALAGLRPHTLVVGANAVPADALARWVAAVRATGDDRALVLVRRGTSLAAVDLAAAAHFGITVRNTPEVNARHVAQFMIDRLFAAAPGDGSHGSPGVLGLLGAGDINSRVARAASTRGWRLVVCSPSLVTDPAALPAWTRRHHLTAENVRVAATAAEVLGAAAALALAVPLVHTGPWASAGLIDADLLERFQGGRIISVSEPEVFTPRALLHAYDRAGLTIALDNAPRLLAPVRDLLAGRITRDGGQPRRGFTLCSAAMRTPACDDDLDQAVLTVVGRTDLDEIAGTDLLAPPAPLRAPAALAVPAPPAVPATPAADDGAVVIVGGGIVGLVTALLLRLRGGRRILVVDAAPADRTDPDRQGTTFGGANARHLSATEALPPAVAQRADVLTRPPALGGWRLRAASSLDPAETAWARAFARRADQPGLHAGAQELAIALNRLGLRGWTQLFEDGDAQSWLGGLRRDARLARVYLDDADLATGERLQQATGDGATRLEPGALARGWPGLGHAVPLPGGVREIAGAVEVDGYAVNIHDLATALTSRLAELGVEVRPDTRVDRLEPAPADDQRDDGLDASPPGVLLRLDGGGVLGADRVVVTAGGRDLDRLLGAYWPGAGAVAHLLGLSLTLPNPGLTRPVKIHAGDPLGVMNVTLSPDGSLVHVSAGFGYRGRAGRAAARAGADELRAVAERAVAGLFPTLCRAAGSLEVRDVRFCERPATPDGLPLVTAVPAHAGRVVVAAGTNAGGAVQAPAVALLVADLLEGAPRCAGLALAGDRVGLPAIPEKIPSASV
ncbi:FAD-dependent oxidoreductase [Frankia sp. AgB32]|uniref:FAD-dependent oxidoreductase n=1 Tax=Frankia sp. AgB32 TaxID=631119 RepID=UPI00200E139F|nr:FAD-dependent oxidoreductase [Frankia sp. AgB32]MCK9896930.1 FAD-dependent oxidoreductase [Frankia sp. AgB32]